MLDVFRQALWGRAIVPCDFLDVAPIRQKPSFKIMLSDVRMKGFVRAGPLPHLRLRVCGGRKVSRAGVNIRQGDDGICGLTPTKKLLNLGPKLVPFRNSAVIDKHIEAGHFPASLVLRKAVRCGLNACSVLPSTRMVIFTIALRDGHCSIAHRENSPLATRRGPVHPPTSTCSSPHQSNPSRLFLWAAGSGQADPRKP